MFIKIINNNNEEIGCIRRDFVVPLGLRHQIGRVIIYSKQNNSLLLQQRSLKKATMPGAWDTSSSGHIDAHESAVAGTVRELREEIGVDVTEDALDYVGAYDTYEKLDDGILDRQTIVYALMIEDPEKITYIVDPVELEGIQWVELSEVGKLADQVTRGALQAIELFSEWLNKQSSRET